MPKKFIFIFLLLLIGGITMPRGGPDGNLSSFSYAAQAVDPALIYQMLWGFSPIDGQGRPIYLDTFNNGLGGFGYDISGGATIPVLFSTPLARVIFSPPNCVKLTPGVASGNLTGLFREMYLGANTRIGLETGVVLGSVTPNYFFRIDYRINASQKYAPILKYDHATTSWLLATSGGDINIFTHNTTGISADHLQIKFVGDWSTGKYVRVLIGDNLLDVSSYSMPTSGSTLDGFLISVFRAISYGAGTGDGYLGYILLTKDEP